MNKPYTAISLFSGAVDGLAIAAQVAGIKVTHHVEWDSWCCRVLRMNHPESTVINADIHDVKGLPYADVIMGGSPCQDFSGAGNQAGFDGKRYLWPEMRRIVRECRPRVVIHENVRGGISLGLLDRICSDMESDGYTVWPLVYPAAVFGAPHERYRMFHIGLLADTEPQRRPEPGTLPNAGTNKQWNVSSFELSRGSISNATESGGEDVGNIFNGGEVRPENKLESGHNSNNGGGTSIRTNHPTETERTGFLLASERPNGQNRTIFKSSMGRTSYGLASRIPRLDPVRDFPGFPAGQGSYQYPYEPPRTTPEKGKYAKERIQALGNAVVWQQAAPIFRTVVRWLEGQDK